ncbi:MAG: hypothetical protein LBT40_06615 [Deltaproteobacteria bacterium]|nr:hypothetical protein [Deltaproteobacteria bacterium]
MSRQSQNTSALHPVVSAGRQSVRRVSPRMSYTLMRPGGTPVIESRVM